jgi:hypothetical protein
MYHYGIPVASIGGEAIVVVVVILLDVGSE